MLPSPPPFHPNPRSGDWWNRTDGRTALVVTHGCCCHDNLRVHTPICHDNLGVRSEAAVEVGGTTRIARPRHTRTPQQRKHATAGPHPRRAFTPVVSTHMSMTHRVHAITLSVFFCLSSCPATLSPRVFKRRRRGDHHHHRTPFRCSFAPRDSLPLLSPYTHIYYCRNYAIRAARRHVCRHCLHAPGPSVVSSPWIGGNGGR